MGYLDANGCITLMGRKKEMFLQGGFNVYPVEVENLLTRHSNAGAPHYDHPIVTPAKTSKNSRIIVS